MTTFPHVRAELLLPSQLEAALATNPVVYVPLGALEFHGVHLPIGLDALNAHGVCLAAASRDGGVVLPPIYYGIGGTHTGYDWTIMMDDAEPVRALVERTLVRLEHFGVRVAVLFSGHFAPQQLEMLDDIASRWNRTGSAMRTIAQAVNMPLPDELPTPDHAGLFETSVLAAFWPELIHLDMLAPLEKAPSIDPGDDSMGQHRHDPKHPLQGVMGADPRTFDGTLTARVVEAIVSQLIASVHASR